MQLPKTYDAARQALSECQGVDECKDWADKAAELASYAKQSQDDQLERMAQRIGARAIRRAGELLRQIEPAPNQHVAGMGALTSRIDAARDAGMSKHQQMQATRVASVSEEDLEPLVESPTPPTISQLAQQGVREGTVTRSTGSSPRDRCRPDGPPAGCVAIPWRPRHGPCRYSR